MKKWWIGLLVSVLVLGFALPAIGTDGTDFAALAARMLSIEKRVDALEASGYARVNTAGNLGSFKSPEGIELSILGVTAGPFGTIVASRITNGSDRLLGFSKGQFVLVAGGQQLNEPMYRFDLTDDTIQPKASQDFIMVFGPLPAGTKTIRFVPKLMWRDKYQSFTLSVEGNVQ